VEKYGKKRKRGKKKKGEEQKKRGKGGLGASGAQEEETRRRKREKTTWMDKNGAGGGAWGQRKGAIGGRDLGKEGKKKCISGEKRHKDQKKITELYRQGLRRG